MIKKVQSVLHCLIYLLYLHLCIMTKIKGHVNVIINMIVSS